MEDIKEEPGWKWFGDWQICKCSKTDDQGWEYAFSFNRGDFTPYKSISDMVRKRK